MEKKPPKIDGQGPSKDEKKPKPPQPLGRCFKKLQEGKAKLQAEEARLEREREKFEDERDRVEEAKLRILRERCELQNEKLQIEQEKIRLFGAKRVKKAKLSLEEQESKEKLEQACAKLRAWEETNYTKRKYHEEGDEPAYFVKPIEIPKVNRNIQVDEKVNLDDEEDEELDEEPIGSLEDNQAAYTGYFNDGIRRIDMVLVVAVDDFPEVEKMKTQFLSNIVRLGLELEFEPGVMKKHKHLLFIKVHAPDKVLAEYGEALSIKKLFKDKHLEFAKSKKARFSFHNLEHEREWLKIVRKQYAQPLNLSNLERSSIVYILLLHQPFGESANHFSLKRLLFNKVILDAYALHDGPYFFMANQDFLKINARQILFYNWTGVKNLFYNQPLHLIHEYFGSMVGFYFVFYEFYNQMLGYAVVPIAILCILMYYWLINVALEGYHSTLCYKFCSTANFSICPECRDFNACPFKEIMQYCTKCRLTDILQMNMYWLAIPIPSLIIFSLIISCWSAAFLIFWKRREAYWAWMWELCHPPQRPTMRPEFNGNYSNQPNRSSRTGILKYYENFFMTIVQHGIGRIILFVMGFSILAIAIGIIYFYYSFLLLKFPEMKYREYVTLVINTLFALTVLFFAEQVCMIASYYVTLFENHRTHEAFERSLIIKMFGFSAGCTFSLIVFYGWLKGMFYTFPHTNWSPTINFTLFNETYSWNADYFGQFIIMNCGPLGCLQDLTIVFLLTLLLRTVLYGFLPRLKRMVSDYNQGQKIIATVPAWEREYQLNAVSEYTMTKMYNTLVIYFGLLVLFVPAFPPAIIIVWLVSKFHLRHEARLLVMGSRRPLLYKSRSIGSWNGVLSFLCYASAITNAVTIVRNDSFINTQVYLKYHHAIDPHPDFILDYYLAKFEIPFYNETAAKDLLLNYKNRIPYTCYFSGMYSIKTTDEADNSMPWPFVWNNVTFDPGNFLAKTEKFYKNLCDALFIISFQFFVVTLMLIMQYYIPTVSKNVKEIMRMEINLKRAHIENKKMDKKDNVSGISTK